MWFVLGYIVLIILFNNLEVNCWDKLFMHKNDGGMSFENLPTLTSAENTF